MSARRCQDLLHHFPSHFKRRALRSVSGGPSSGRPDGRACARSPRGGGGGGRAPFAGVHWSLTLSSPRHGDPHAHLPFTPLPHAVQLRSAESVPGTRGHAGVQIPRSQRGVTVRERAHSIRGSARARPAAALTAPSGRSHAEASWPERGPSFHLQQSFRSVRVFHGPPHGDPTVSIRLDFIHVLRCCCMII